MSLNLSCKFLCSTYINQELSHETRRMQVYSWEKKMYEMIICNAMAFCLNVNMLSTFSIQSNLRICSAAMGAYFCSSQINKVNIRIYKCCKIQKTHVIALQYYLMISEALQQYQVVFCHGKWTEEVSLQVRDLTDWDVTEFLLYFNNRATIVREITHARFTTLNLLSLGGNEIDCIEGLARVQMPHICILYLFGNEITSVRVMGKTVWPSLQQLDISNNRFGDGKSLALGCLPQMQQLQVYLALGDNNPFTEQGFLAKFQAPSLQVLGTRDKFCRDRCISRVLQQKWPNARNIS